MSVCTAEIPLSTSRSRKTRKELSFKEAAAIKTAPAAGRKGFKIVNVMVLVVATIVEVTDHDHRVMAVAAR